MPFGCNYVKMTPESDCEMFLVHFIIVSICFQVFFNAGQRQCGVSDHDGPAGGDGVRHRSPEAAALRPD